MGMGTVWSGSLGGHGLLCYIYKEQSYNIYLSSTVGVSEKPERYEHFTTPVSNDSYSKIHELLLKLFSPSEQRNRILDLLSPPLICPSFSLQQASCLQVAWCSCWSFVEANLRFWPFSLSCSLAFRAPISPAVLIGFDAFWNGKPEKQRRREPRDGAVQD